MAISALTDVELWFAQYRLSTDHNQLGLEIGYDENDDTVFQDTARSITGGLAFTRLVGSGFVTIGNGNVHEVLRSNVNVANVPVTVSPDGGDDGDYAEFFLSKTLSYQTLGQVGQIMPFTFNAHGQGTPSIKGTILGVGSKASTANGTARQLGAVSATQRLYAALHVISVSGVSPTLDVVIASDNASNFPSGTTRITFAQKTAAGHEWLSVAGAITDDWWRAQWTIGGSSSPTFDVVIVAGIF